MDNVLSVKDLTKIYFGKKTNFIAVNSISFSLKKGEILGFLGPNGSGKTTTMNMLLGTLTATSGSILYFGKDFFQNRSDILQQVSFASAYTNLPWLLTVKENLTVFGYLYGLSRKESEQRFTPLLERFGILDKKNKRVSSLSAGQTTRLMIIKAFFMNPKIVLLDEPTASLDPQIAQDICSFLLEQREKHGTSILFCSHKMQEVMEICDRTIFLKDGNIIANDVPRKLAKSVSTFRLQFVVLEGLQAAENLAKERNYKYKVEHRTIEILLEEEQIPELLKAFSTASISYTNIRIEEPSLDDFFLALTRNQI